MGADLQFKIVVIGIGILSVVTTVLAVFAL
jgi:hypothetical protein